MAGRRSAWLAACVVASGVSGLGFAEAMHWQRVYQVMPHPAWVFDVTYFVGAVMVVYAFSERSVPLVLIATAALVAGRVNEVESSAVLSAGMAGAMFLWCAVVLGRRTLSWMGRVREVTEGRCQ